MTNQTVVLLRNFNNTKYKKVVGICGSCIRGRNINPNHTSAQYNKNTNNIIITHIIIIIVIYL